MTSSSFPVNRTPTRSRINRSTTFPTTAPVMIRKSWSSRNFPIPSPMNLRSVRKSPNQKTGSKKSGNRKFIRKLENRPENPTSRKLSSSPFRQTFLVLRKFLFFYFIRFSNGCITAVERTRTSWSRVCGFESRHGSFYPLNGSFLIYAKLWWFGNCKFYLHRMISSYHETVPTLKVTIPRITNDLPIFDHRP